MQGRRSSTADGAACYGGKPRAADDMGACAGQFDVPASRWRQLGGEQAFADISSERRGIEMRDAARSLSFHEMIGWTATVFQERRR